jgi:uncharacterized protein YjbJ (UPF0337 family)
MAGDVKDKVSDLVSGKEDKIDSAIDKTGDFVDDKTGGKFSDKIDSAQDAAKGAVDKVSGDDDEEASAAEMATPEAPTPPEDQML